MNARWMKYSLILIALVTVTYLAYFISETSFPLIGKDEPWAYIMANRRLLVSNSSGWVESDWPYQKPEGFDVEFPRKHVWIYSAKHEQHDVWVACFHYPSDARALASFDSYVSKLAELYECKKLNIKYTKTCEFNPGSHICLPNRKGYPGVEIEEHSTLECGGKIIHVERIGNSIFVAIASKSEEKFMQEALAISWRK